MGPPRGWGLRHLNSGRTTTFQKYLYTLNRKHKSCAQLSPTGQCWHLNEWEDARTREWVNEDSLLLTLPLTRPRKLYKSALQDRGGMTKSLKWIKPDPGLLRSLELVKRHPNIPSSLRTLCRETSSRPHVFPWTFRGPSGRPDSNHVNASCDQCAQDNGQQTELWPLSVLQRSRFLWSPLLFLQAGGWGAILDHEAAPWAGFGGGTSEESLGPGWARSCPTGPESSPPDWLCVKREFSIIWRPRLSSIFCHVQTVPILTNAPRTPSVSIEEHHDAKHTTNDHTSLQHSYFCGSKDLPGNHAFVTGTSAFPL